MLTITVLSKAINLFFLRFKYPTIKNYTLNYLFSIS